MERMRDRWEDNRRKELKQSMEILCAPRNGPILFIEFTKSTGLENSPLETSIHRNLFCTEYFKSTIHTRPISSRACGLSLLNV